MTSKFLNIHVKFVLNRNVATTKPGFTKLFRVSVKSLGTYMMMRTVGERLLSNALCSKFQYNKENFREYALPDKYFEYTDNGYYEKVIQSHSCPVRGIQNNIPH